MNELEDQLGRILNSLQELQIGLESLRVSIQPLIHSSSDHEQRLRTLERWQHNLTPVLAVSTFVLGSLFSVCLNRFL